MRELLTLAGSVARRQDLDGFARVVAERLRDVLSVQECDVFLHEGERLSYLASLEPRGFDETVVGTAVDLSDHPLSSAALARKEVLVVTCPDDPRLTDHERDSIVGYGFASELWIPLAVGDRVVGAVDLYDDKPRDFAEARDFVAHLAFMLAGAMDNVLLLEEVARNKALVGALAEIGEFAAQTHDVDPFLVGVAERVLRVADAVDCDIFTLDPDGELRCAVSIDSNGRDTSVEGAIMTVHDLGASVGAVFDGEISVVSSRDDPRLRALDLEVYETYGFHSDVCVPLMSGSDVVGLILIYSDRPRDWAELLDFLKHLGRIVGGALERAVLVRDLARSNRDLALAHESGVALAASLDLDAVLRATALRLSRALDAPCCEVFLGTSPDEVRCAISVGGGEIDETRTGLKHLLDDVALVRTAMERRESIVVAALDDPRRRRRMGRGRRSALAIPLVAGGDALGAVVLAEAGHQREFAPQEIATGEAICRVAALAIHSAELHRREQEQSRRLSLLLDSGRAIASSMALDDVLTTVAKAAVDMLAAGDAVIFAYDESSETLTNVSLCQTNPGIVERRGEVRPVDDYPLGRDLLERDDVLEEHLSDPDLDPASRASMEKWGELTCLTVPVKFEGSPMGLLVLTESARERHFTADEVALARGLGEMAAVALNSSAVFRRQAEQTTRLESLLAGSRAVATATELEAALGAVARVTAEVLRVPECMIFEFDEEADAIIPRASFEEKPSGWDGLGALLPLAEHPIERRLLASGAVLEEQLSDPGLDPASRTSMQTWGEKTCLTVPIRYGEECRGLITVYELDGERHFTEEEVALVRGLGEQAAAAIHSAQILRRLEERNRRLASLFDAGQAVSAATSLDIALGEVARTAVEGLGTSFCLVSEYLQETAAMVERAFFSSDPEERYQTRSWALTDDEWDTRAVMDRGAVAEETLSDPALRPGIRGAMERWGEKTYLTVPLVFRDARVGTMVLGETRRERHFTDEEREYATALGRQAAAAIHSARQLAGLEERNLVLTALLDASRATTSQLDLNAVLRAVAREAATALASPSCDIWEYNAEAGTLTERECYDVTGAYQAGNDVELLSDHPEQALALLADGPLVETLSDPDLHPLSRASMEKWEEKTCLSVPLDFAGERLGLLVFSETERERVFTAAELDLARGLADLAAVAIHNARTYGDLQHRNDELAAKVRRERFVSESSAELSSSLEIREILNAAAHRFADHFDARACDVYLLDDDRELLCVASVLDGHDCDELVGTHLSTEEFPIDKTVLETGRTVVIDSRDDPRLTEHERRDLEVWDCQTMLIVPLVAKDRLFGTVTLYDRGLCAYSAEQIATVEAVCRMAALAVENASQFRGISELNARLAEHAKRMTTVSEIGLELGSTLQLQDVLVTAAARLAEVVDMTGCDVYRLYGDELVCEASILNGRPCPEWVGQRLSRSDSSMMQYVTPSGSPFAVSSLEDPRLDDDDRRVLEEWGEKCLLVLPLVARGTLVGAIGLTDTRSERGFSAEAIGAAEAIARMTALAIDNAGLFTQQVDHARRLGALLEASRTITASVVTRDVLQAIAEQAAAALGSPECIIFTYDADTDTLAAMALHQETPTPFRELGAPFPVTDGSLDRRLLEDDRIVVETISDPDLHPESRASMEEWGEKTCVNVPLRFGHEPLGILVLIETERERAFTDGDLEILTGLSAEAAIALHHASLFEHLKRRTFETEVLNEMAREASSSLRAPAIAEATLRQLRRLVDFDAATVLLPGAAGLETVYAYPDEQRAAAGLPEHLDSWLTEQLRTEELAIVHVPHDRYGADEDEEDPHAVACVALHADDERIGILALTSAHLDAFKETDRRVLQGAGAHLSLSLRNARLFEHVKQLQLGNLRALSSALLAKDYYTIGHTARVAAYAVMLAKELGWSHTDIADLEEVAFLHDIGKIAVSDHVLLKPTPLTTEEWNLMRDHPVVSAEMLAPLMDHRLLAGVRYHHERYDGNGYPDGLAGEDIPEIARLMAVVDAYDAMSSRRVYRNALDRDEAVAELQRCRGAQFDPPMVDAFLRVLEAIEEKRVVATAAAEAAAERVDPRKHALLRTPADAQRPAYLETLEALRTVADRFPQVNCISTEVQVDERRVMMVVDTDPDPDTQSPIGQLLFADEVELEMFRGRRAKAGVVYVDPWGVWVEGVAPIRDEAGTIVAVACADIPATDEPGLALARSDVNTTFAQLARDAADRTTFPPRDTSTDHLTGLPTLHSLLQRLAQECSVADAPGEGLALLFCDIDGIGELNERLGRLAGDAALKSVAGILETYVRDVDLAARCENDQYAVLLTGVGGEVALGIAERIRAAVRRTGPRSRDRKLTVSIGVATLGDSGPTMENLIDAAEEALLLARVQGGDRCVLFSQHTLAHRASGPGKPRAAAARRVTTGISPGDMDGRTMEGPRT